MTEFTVTPQQE